MNSDEATVVVIGALDALHVPYMMVGSFSTNFYGIPRSTHGGDIVVQLQPGNVVKLAEHLGPPFRLDPQMTFETVTATNRYVLNMDDNPFSIELFLLSDDPHDCERLRGVAANESPTVMSSFPVQKTSLSRNFVGRVPPADAKTSIGGARLGVSGLSSSSRSSTLTA